MLRRISTLLSDDRGATAIEYSLIAALVVLMMVTALVQLADANTGMWDDVSTKVQTSSAAAAAGAS